MAKAPVAKNQEMTVTIDDLTYEGMGVAKVAHYPLFVEGALPGEEVRVRIVKAEKKYAFARLEEVLVASPDRVAPKAKAYAQTGIAPLQHLAYPAQLAFKQHQVETLYQKAHLTIPVRPTLGMTTPSGYRNKAQIPVRMVNGELTTGFYKRRSHDLLPLEDFYIQDPHIDHAVLVVRDLLRQFQVPAYDEATNSGVIRHIMVRRGYYSKQMMIVLVSRTWVIPHLDELMAGITAALPEVTSLMLNLNDQATNVILGKKTRTLFGQDYLEDQLLGSTFRISPLSFYQVNPTQTEVLYTEAVRAAGLTGQETVIDAYSGIGTISLTMAKHAKQVYGVEVVPEAVKDAQTNARLNGLTNVDFVLGKAEDVMQDWQAQGLTADVLMVDPPRKGLAPSFIAAVGKMLPPKVVYVSCNPATLARDIAALQAFGYRATATQPVDMFPQTTSIESVTVLTR
ncbi:23S rRNA (uracil(1939)-C(5))-methyltransferase RlmD [Lacticaseibacillus daqingensis]|uniref:23S rRNA (uracil(1939)-C(5))-methyltransferase RlmD n=1 Tax=Lacticaseibacillus daqingensis TaxID=2486014 RepID=UPI000F7BA2AE|nr:23S rRNA (uracil(1939)-C(5))-methyltransferase RlmD [Lacticaseibacillus daqingensis]